MNLDECWAHMDGTDQMHISEDGKKGGTRMGKCYYCKGVDSSHSGTYSTFPMSWPLGYLLYIGRLTKFIAGFTRQAGVDKRNLLIVNLVVDLCPIYLPLS